jgi:hypothetical protein
LGKQENEESTKNELEENRTIFQPSQKQVQQELGVDETKI